MSRRPTTLLPTLLATAGIALGPAADAASSPTPRAWTSFDVVATASAIVVDSDVPGGPADDGLVAADGARSQARIDGLGRSEAEAAAVAPGDTIRSLRGVAANLARGPLPVSPVPEIPMIVETSYPTATEASTGDGGLALRASSGPDASASSVDWEAAVTSGRTTATATGTQRSALRAVATTDLVGFAAGPVRIGRVVSHASVERAPGQAIRPSAALDITDLTVGDSSVSVGPDSPFVSEAVEIRYLEAQATDTGVVAPGLVVRIAVPASPTEGPSVVTFILGRSTAAVAATAAPTPSRPPAPSTGRGATPPAPAGESPFAPSLPRSETVPVTVTPSPAPASPADPTTTAVEIAAPRIDVAPAARTEPWSMAWYLPLVAVAVAIATAHRWFRHTGVRGTWS